METFIEQSVKFLYHKYDREISDINIIFPSRRGKMFFNMALSHRIKGKPIWQPRFLTMDDLISERTGIETADNLRLLVELYKIFNTFHNESFDKFYFWGEILLADFDMLDNYLIDARLLYSNIKDIKEIEQLFGEGTQEQIELITSFWGNINSAATSVEKGRFLTIWNTLFDIYTQFRARLTELGIGYKGMISRMAAENNLQTERQRYAIIGFNALSNSEKAIFKHLKENHECDFLWDYDDYYTLSQSEAGIFIRENIQLFGESNSEIIRNNFISKKEIRVVASPTDSLSAKYTWQFLEECATTETVSLAQETAIVMTDESLLLPIMYSIPPSVDAFNVTSGFEVRTTQPYALTEELIELQTAALEGKFYHKNIRNILTNGDIKQLLSVEEQAFTEEYLSRAMRENTVFDSCADLVHIPVLKTIFEIQHTSNSFSEWLKTILQRITTAFEEGDDALKNQFYFTLYNAIAKTQALFEQCGMEVSNRVYISALRKVLHGTKISFDGEPLVGVQVMGILETRNIDFKNVLLLSVGEDNFPSSGGGKSFIPPNLRLGYGLPTISHHEAMYSYYFYRLLQRAEKVDIVYCSGSGGLNSGEPSRYIHQLRYESPHTIEERTINVNVTIKPKEEEIYPKDNRIERYWNENSQSYLSPTALISFLECPLRFYYKYIEGIQTEEEQMQELLDDRISGNILHKTLQEIYTPLILLSHEDLVVRLRSYNKQKIGALVECAIKETLQGAYKDESGEIAIKQRIIESYLQNTIAYDLSRNDGFMVQALEEEFRHYIIVGDKKIKVGGTIDRIDALPDGSVLIIDYKSGARPKVNDLDKIFDRTDKCRNKDLVQTLLYTMLWRDKHGYPASSAIYYLRELKSGYKAAVTDESGTFEAKIKELLIEFSNKEIPFTQTQLKENCTICPFSTLCTL